MSKILITGGTGLVGSRLIKELLRIKHEIVLLGRTPSNDPNHFLWNIDKGYIDEAAFEGIDYIIHLAGANIAEKRWTKKRKEILVNSRVNSTRLLYNYCNARNIRLKGFISASAIGFYGAITQKNTFKETDPAGSDFLAKLCAQWENEVHHFSTNADRVIIIRSGIILSKTGGALEKLMKPFRFGIAANLGSGNQIMPWIHIDDIIKIFVNTISNTTMTGTYNGVAPEAVTHSQFMSSIAKILHKKIRLPSIPTWLLKLMLGELALTLTTGSDVSANKLMATGFTFNYTNHIEALTDQLIN